MPAGTVLLYTFLGLSIFFGLKDVAHGNRVIHRDWERIARQLERQNGNADRDADGERGTSTRSLRPVF